jgi:hypothetical protein
VRLQQAAVPHCRARYCAQIKRQSNQASSKILHYYPTWCEAKMVECPTGHSIRSSFLSRGASRVSALSIPDNFNGVFPRNLPHRYYVRSFTPYPLRPLFLTFLEVPFKRLPWYAVLWRVKKCLKSRALELTRRPASFRAIGRLGKPSRMLCVLGDT